MKKVLAPLLISFMLSSCSHKHEVHPGDQVYLCDSKSSVAYHSVTTCKALQRCNHTIREMSVETAEAYGRHECPFCCK